MKKLILATVATVLAFSFSTSYAACTKQGYVERVDNLPGTGASKVYIRTSSVATVLFTATTADPKIVAAADAAATSRTWVTVIGGVTSCPASGNIGGITQLVVAP